MEQSAQKEKATLFLEYRGLDIDVLVEKVRSIRSRISMIFITRNLKNVMSNRKDRIPGELNSIVI